MKGCATGLFTSEGNGSYVKMKLWVTTGGNLLQLALRQDTRLTHREWAQWYIPLLSQRCGGSHTTTASLFLPLFLSLVINEQCKQAHTHTHTTHTHTNMNMNTNPCLTIKANAKWTDTRHRAHIRQQFLRGIAPKSVMCWAVRTPLSAAWVGDCNSDLCLLQDQPPPTDFIRCRSQAKKQLPNNNQTLKMPMPVFPPVTAALMQRTKANHPHHLCTFITPRSRDWIWQSSEAPRKK